MTARGLAWRTVTSKPARTALAVTGVAIIGALLFDMLMLSRGLLVSFRDLLDAAGYDVRVVASDGLPMLRAPIPSAGALVAEIAGRPEVAEVALVRRDRAMVSVQNRPPVVVTLISVSAGADRRAWRLRSGRNLSDASLVSTEPPLVLSEALASALGVEPGSPVRLRDATPRAVSAAPAVTFTVAGVAEFDLEPGDDLVAATTIEGFQKAHGGATDDADIVLVRSRPEFGADQTATAIGRIRPDLRAYSNEQIVSQFNQNGFTYFRQISVVLSSITLGFAFLLMATLLSVSVNQRLNEVAALRALGLPRRRIAATLIWESAWLVGAGGLLSLPLGGALAIQLDRILRSMPGFPLRLHFFVFEPGAVGQHLGLLAAAAVAASLYPMWVATRLPIAATLRRETVS